MTGRVGSHFFSGNQSFSKGTSLCLMILSGDVETNPGPTQYPSSVCEMPVRSNPQALLCDHWAHCKCSGISKRTYNDY